MATGNNNARRVSCGLDFCVVDDLISALDIAYANNFDFICVPISHPRFKTEFLCGPSKNRDSAFTTSDLDLSSKVRSYSVVAKCNSYLNCDSVNSEVRKFSEQTLLQELLFANHLAIGVTLVSITRPNNANLARIINSIVSIARGIAYPIWAHVLMVYPSVKANHYRSNYPKPESDTWEWWNTFRCLCNYDKNVGLALELTKDLPSNEAVARWLGEPVKCLIIPTNVFVTNLKGFSVLPKPHEAVVTAFAGMNVQVIISGTQHHESISYYVQYIKRLWQTLISGDPMMLYAQGFEDYLQVPLQPLMDNLDSNTYEVFEKDPVKYNAYQRAIFKALLDRVPNNKKYTTTQVIMVVGAGRGPLVNAALNAARRADRKVKVYAVEKNPNAVVTLQAHKEELWHDQVTIVSCDIRKWCAPEPADILVSELLGSFGDNKLSPECLDEAQKFLKDDGISIPCSYTSYLAPVHSPKLYDEISARYRDPTKISESYNFEMPWVVHQQNRLPLADSQPLFTYYHPNEDPIIDNSRYRKLTFPVKTNSVLHGFTGYFETVLYREVMLSIRPMTYTQGMVSWFPIFFPIKEPVMLKAGQDVVVHFWRLHNKKGVWYEWTVTSPVPLSIHNPNGRAYIIGL